MAKNREKYNEEKTRVLAELREKAKVSQEEAANFFGLKDRNTIAAWELGYSRPRKTLRSAFIVYLWDKLRLRRDSKQFNKVWKDVMVGTWGWSVLENGELPSSHSNEDTTRSALVMPPVPINERLSVGGLPTNMIVLSWENYKAKQIRCSYSDQDVPLPRDIIRLKEEFVQDCKEREARGEAHVPYNSLTYKLKTFDVGYRDIVDGEEIPILYLSFGPTDYFTHRVTDLNVHNPVRDKYMRRARDITTEPVPEFATTLGINLNLITEDDQLLLTERSLRTETEPNTFHTSVGEGLLRPVDAGPDGAPDPFRCAIRGTLEELGISLKPDDVEFNAFCVHAERGQYSLFGWSRIKETRAQIEKRRMLAAPKDKWENRSLLFLLCNPASVAEIAVKSFARWSDTGLASLIFSLMQLGYPVEEIDEAFLRARGLSIERR